MITLLITALVHVTICCYTCFRLGPPDFHPQTPNCPEETLTKEYVQSGYRETVEGLEVHFCYQLISGGIHRCLGRLHQLEKHYFYYLLYMVSISANGYTAARIYKT